MNIDKLSEYNTYHKIIKCLLLVLGLYPLDTNRPFYHFLPYLHLFLNLSAAFGMVGFVRAHITNVLVVTKRLGVMVSFITVSLKLLCMIIKRKDIRKLFKILDAYFNDLINNPQYTNIVFNGITTFRRLSWAISILVFISGIINIIMPIVFVFYQQAHDIQPVKFILPNLSIYPWQVQPNGLLFKLHYILESLAILSLIAITSSIEPLFTLYVVQMIGRLREMSDRMIFLDNTKNYDSIIRESIHQYTIVLKCRNMIQNIFGPIILWMVGTNAIILCLGIFQLSQMKSISTGQLLFFIAYVGTKMIQTFICGWTGTRFTAESEDYKAAVYATNWQGNKRLMTSVIIMLSQKPLTFTACHFCIISVDIFISVLNTTMSYFFLLQTLQYKNSI